MNVHVFVLRLLRFFVLHGIVSDPKKKQNRKMNQLTIFSI